MASDNTAILVAGSEDAPFGYTVPNTQTITPLCCNATFDGSGASGDFVPTLEIVSDSGIVIARCPASTTVVAGDSAEVTFAPFLRASSTGGGTSGIFFDTKNGLGQTHYFALFTSGTVGLDSGIELVADGDGGINIAANNTPGHGTLTMSGKNVDLSADLDTNISSTNGDIVISANSTGNSVFIAPDPAGYIVLENLPTSSPGGTGRVWNSGGVLHIT